MTWHEADFVVEALPDAVETPAERPCSVLIAGAGARRHITSASGHGRLWREGLRDVAVDVQKAESKVRIDAADTVVMASSLLFVEEDNAHVRVRQDVAAQSKGAEVGRRYRSLLALLDVQQAERIAALASCQARTRQDGNRLCIVGQADAAAEKQPHLLRRVLAGYRASAPASSATAEPAEAAAKLEDAGVLEKEVTLFRKEQTESRKVDLLLVRFHL